MYLILFGLPGAGKGTQAGLLSQSTGLVHITSGELFRDNIRKQTELGRKAEPYVEEGRLVPDEITVAMILDRVSRADAAGGFILDGYPRTVEQAMALDDALARESKQIDRAVYVGVSTEELVRRLAGRWNCSRCGAVYHEQSHPPQRAGVCDACGGELYQREDDRPDVVRTRLEVNRRETERLLEYYRSRGKLAEVDGEQPVQNVTQDVLSAIGRRQGVS